MGNQAPPVVGFQPIIRMVPQRDSIGAPQSRPQQFLTPVGAPSQTLDVPLPSPDKVPSFLAATQAYEDFQDLNSKSNIMDDVMKDVGK